MWKCWSLEIDISVSLIVLISYSFDVYFSWAIPSVSEGGSLLKSTFSLCEKQIIFYSSFIYCQEVGWNVFTSTIEMYDEGYEPSTGCISHIFNLITNTGKWESRFFILLLCSGKITICYKEPRALQCSQHSVSAYSKPFWWSKSIEYFCYIFVDPWKEPMHSLKSLSENMPSSN